MTSMTTIIKTRMAHIGASINQDSPGELFDSDRYHMDDIMDWLFKRGDHECLYYENRDDDFIDLNDNRDFLAENHKYDIVVLHLVYSPADPVSNSCRFGPNSCSPFRTSRRHTKEAWRHRLASTNAKYVFTFGDFDEVSGEYLGPIDGYEGPIEIKDMFQAYVKN